METSLPQQPIEGDVFNETTGQWESLPTAQNMPITQYPTIELPNTPLNPLLQEPGTVPYYTEGDQNYQYAPPTSTFDPTSNGTFDNVITTYPGTTFSEPSPDSLPESNPAQPSLFSDPVGAVSSWVGSAWSYVKNLF